MAVRFYLVPKIGDGLTPFTAFRPKYTGPNDLGPGISLAGRWSANDYGLEDCFLLCADVTTSEHTALNAQTDVLAVPLLLDNQVSALAVGTIQTKLEDLKLPAEWVTTALTYRQVVRRVRKIIAFVQRFRGLFGESPFVGGLTLDSQVNDIPQAKRQRLADTADDLGLDRSSITSTTTIRAALRILADQLPDATMRGEAV